MTFTEKLIKWTNEQKAQIIKINDKNKIFIPIEQTVLLCIISAIIPIILSIKLTPIQNLQQIQDFLDGNIVINDLESNILIQQKELDEYEIEIIEVKEKIEKFEADKFKS